MQEVKLLIMAAGMGSRYGGLKQMDPLGPNGEVLFEYSIYDAWRAGFKEVIFVIKKDFEEEFRQLVQARIPEEIKLHFAFQELEDIPVKQNIPEERVKPWGTAHAVYAARAFLDSPFVVINADDYYGPEAFKLIYQELSQDKTAAMVAFHLGNTLTENGSVSRGICSIEEGYLKEVVEHTEIIPKGKDALSIVNKEEILFPANTPVSMNFWGFQANFIQAIERTLVKFFEEELKENPLKKESYLPSVVMNELKAGKMEVKVLESSQKWMGVTYKEDKELVKEGFEKLLKEGIYPKSLWQ